MNPEDVFLSIVLLLNIFSRNLFEEEKEKCEMICKKNKKLSKIIVLYAVLFSFSRNHYTTMSGVIIYILLNTFSDLV